MKGTAHWIIKRMIGDITPTIIDINLNSSKQVIVSFDISGLSEQYEERADYSILYWKQGDSRRYRTAPERIMENGVNLKMIEGLTSGTWGFKVIVYPERFYNHPLFASYYSFDTQILYLSIPPIDIKSISQIWENTDTDPVQFQFKVIVDYQSDVDKDLIKYNDGYGICVTQNGERTIYPSNESNGTSSAEEYLIPINVKKSDFDVDPINKTRRVYLKNDIIFQTYYMMDGYIQYGSKKSVNPYFIYLCPDDNHPHMIDLGMSIKWACCNVGANKPVEYGDYFAWGETKPKKEYSWSTYKYGELLTLTKYTNKTYGYDDYCDDLHRLESVDDAAHVNWGSRWRTPSAPELKELCNKCTWTKITQDNVSGVLVTSNISGYEGASIFLPAAGRYVDSRLVLDGRLGFYWSDSISIDQPWAATYVRFNDDGSCFFYWDMERYSGNSVRPVCP